MFRALFRNFALHLASSCIVPYGTLFADMARVV
jgi:hypothetical protein